MLTKRMPFELSEYRQRLEKCQEMMREKGLDLLLVHTPETVSYTHLTLPTSNHV